MEFKEYQAKAQRTARSTLFDGAKTVAALRVQNEIVHAVINLGELAEIAKKAIHHDHGPAWADKRMKECDRWHGLADIIKSRAENAVGQLYNWTQPGTARPAIVENERWIAKQWSAIGLFGEVAEVIKLVEQAHHAVVNGGTSIEIYQDEAIKELGDVLWYLADVANLFGLSLEEIAQTNIHKLEVRHGLSESHPAGAEGGFTVAGSLARPDETK